MKYLKEKQNIWVILKLKNLLEELILDALMKKIGPQLYYISLVLKISMASPAAGAVANCTVVNPLITV